MLPCYQEVFDIRLLFISVQIALDINVKLVINFNLFLHTL